ncbi:MAG TPA: hypothetical protein VM657_05910 [Sphingomonas sp.]|nr:hypothetical protein [Sphingomonas sp.]
MELLLILYAMLAGLTGLSGQGPARAQVTLGSTTAIAAARPAEARVVSRAVIRGDRAPAALRVLPDARRVASAVRVLVLAASTRAAPERRRE